MMAYQDKISLSHAVERDLRLDLFRGVGLWMIFLDHIPHDVVSWLTLRNYGFSDTSEVFVFVSGCTCILAYGCASKAGAPRRCARCGGPGRSMRRSWFC